MFYLLARDSSRYIQSHENQLNGSGDIHMIVSDICVVYVCYLHMFDFYISSSILLLI